MKILHVTPYFPPAFRYGGPPRSVFSLCRALQAKGEHVSVLTTTADGPGELPHSLGSVDTYEGIPVRYLPRAFPKRFFGASGLRSTLRTILPVYDVVHVHGLWNIPACVTARMARRRGIPYLVSPRGMLQPKAVSRGWLRKSVAYRLVEKRNLAGAAVIHATSAEEAEAIERLGLRVPVVTIPNGVDTPRRVGKPGEFRRQYGLSDDEPLIVFLGRIHPVKRIDLIVAAFARLRRRCPLARLILAGPDDGGTGAALRNSHPSMTESVIWAGQVDQDDKWRLLTDASVVVLCSDTESFGLAAAEALAAGTPVVATKTCPWGELEQYRCGRWVDQDPDAIAVAIEHILADPGEAQKMGARGRTLILERYSWDPIAMRLTDAYRQALSMRLNGGAVPTSLASQTSRSSSL